MRIVVLYYFSVVLFQSFAQSSLVVLQGPTQGTIYNIKYLDIENRNFQNKIEEILKSFDNSVSTYNPNSIISRINRNDSLVEIDEYFRTCFVKAKEIWKQTDGSFDPTVQPLVNAFGFGQAKASNISSELIDSLLQFINFDLIDLVDNRIVKKDSRVQLDFNAFAQGYSVDLIAQFLEENRIQSFIIEIGGEVYAKGHQENLSPWYVGIEKPIENVMDENPYEVILPLENQAIATSGNYRKFVVENGVKYGHQLNPKTGYPAKNNLLSVTIIANNCLSADAYATGILVLGLEKGLEFLQIHPELEAYLIYSNENGQFQTFASPSLIESLIFPE